MTGGWTDLEKCLRSRTLALPERRYRLGVQAVGGRLVEGQAGGFGVEQHNPGQDIVTPPQIDHALVDPGVTPTGSGRRGETGCVIVVSFGF